MASDERPAESAAGAAVPAATVPVWDTAVRVFHWSLVAAVVTSWITGGSGDRLHETVGYAVAGLVAFRMAWGFFGTRHARFRDFVRGPASVMAYGSSIARLRPTHHTGHNPAGAAMIVTLLAVLLAIIVTGVMMQTNRFFGVEWVEQVHSVAANSLLVLVPLHVLGALLSSWMHQENLIRSMFTGHKHLPQGHAAASVQERLEFRLRGAEGLFMLSILTLAGAAYGWLSAPVVAPATSASVATTPAPAAAPASQAVAVAQGSDVPKVVQAKAPTPTRMIDLQDYMTGGPPDPSQLWMLASGGRLYDRWYAALGKRGPTANHPSWPTENTNVSGAETWRCKSCHGWDYLGRDGLLKSGSGATGVRGVTRMRGRPVEDIVAVLENSTHRYSDDLIPGHAKRRLAAFVSQGQHVAAKYIDPDGEAKGNTVAGRNLFQTMCAACHGFDGKARKLGLSADPAYAGKPLYVGTKARQLPVEVLHKIRNGHPGAAMISLRGLPMQSAVDVLAYIQHLPIE